MKPLVGRYLIMPDMRMMNPGIAVLAVAVLILTTACGTSDGHASGGAFLALSVAALFVSVVLVNTVGKVFAQLFDLSLTVLKAVATVGLTVALVLGAVVLAIIAVAAR